MKQKHNAGYSLIETVIAIAILGLITVPSCSALLMSIRINEKAQQVMQAQLAVSSAVETLMAEGITEASADYKPDLYPDVEIKTEEVIKEDVKMPYYKVTVICDDVSVETVIRAVPDEEGGEDS